MSDLYRSGLPLGEALIARSATTRIMARLTASPVGQHMADFINAEVARPAFELSAFLIAVARFQLPSHASMLPHFLDADGYDAPACVYRALIDREYVEHARRTAQHLEAQR